MKFNGTGWETFGSPDFSDGHAYSTSLALNPDGLPYVAYSDSTWGFKAVVMKYDNVATKINEPEGSSFSLYPNPATSAIIIEQNRDGGDLISLEILDGMGRKMADQEMTGTKTLIGIKNYPPGI